MSITINQLLEEYRAAIKAGSVPAALAAKVAAVPANVKFNRPDYLQEFKKISGYSDPFSSTIAGDPVYIIEITKPTNGTVTADAAYCTAGTEVTITATPAEGYEVSEISVLEGETSVTVENSKFTMPAGDVIITVTFAEKVVEQEETTTGTE